MVTKYRELYAVVKIALIANVVFGKNEFALKMRLAVGDNCGGVPLRIPGCCDLVLNSAYSDQFHRVGDSAFFFVGARRETLDA